MANQLLTTNLVTKEILRVLRQKLTILRKINRQYDSKFAVAGAKVGNTIDIRVPTRGAIREGRVMDTSDLVDRTVPLSLTDQTGVDLTYSSADMSLDIDEFRARYLDQRIADLATRIESRMIQRALPSVYNQVGDPATKLELIDALNANKVLTDNNASQPRFLMTNTSGTVQVVDQLKGLFNSQPQVKNQYEDGIMARAAGFDWFETTVAPMQSRGSGAGYLVNGANQSGSSLIVDTGTGTINEGDVFTIPNVFAVNPQTKVSTGQLQRFVARANYAGGAGTVSIAPAITLTGPEQNVTALPADNAALTIQGTASTSYGVNLAFARDFMTFATADLPLPDNKDASRMQFDGLSLRMVRDYDTVNDMFLNRVDILWGSAVLRPEEAVRIPNDITLLT